MCRRCSVFACPLFFCTSFWSVSLRCLIFLGGRVVHDDTIIIKCSSYSDRTGRWSVWGTFWEGNVLLKRAGSCLFGGREKECGVWSCWAVGLGSVYLSWPSSGCCIASRRRYPHATVIRGWEEGVYPLPQTILCFVHVYSVC